MTAVSMQAIRVLLIEDHLVVRAALRMLIESRPGLVVVGEAANHAEALALAAREQPDIILLDLVLGAENGLELLPELRAAARDARVLVLTALHSVDAHRQAIRQGAMGLVLKEHAPEVLFKAIEKIYSGEIWLDQAMLVSVLGGLVSDQTRPADTAAARMATLSERERDVMALIGQGFKNKQISERLSITETTVRHHLTSIFVKLGVESRIELVIFAHQHGLITWSHTR